MYKKYTFTFKVTGLTQLADKLFESATAVKLLDIAETNGKVVKKKEVKSHSKRDEKGRIKTGYKYKKGTHWTQKAANKARLKRILSNAHKALIEHREKAAKKGD